jgi:hypothetical protein
VGVQGAIQDGGGGVDLDLERVAVAAQAGEPAAGVVAGGEGGGAHDRRARGGDRLRIRGFDGARLGAAE